MYYSRIFYKYSEMEKTLPYTSNTRIKSLLLILFGIICASFTFAQTHEVVINKATVSPVVDGIADPVWAQAVPFNITLPYRTETPTLGTEGQTWWKSLWTDKGIYILVNVTDNVFSPPYLGTDPGTNWMYDKVEIYFDCNYIKKDGLGADRSQGHYCYAPAVTEEMIKTGLPASISFTGSTYCYKLNGQSYVAEYFIPFSELLDKDGLPLDKAAPIGFDITVIDNDVKSPVRNRMVWANNGTVDENWNNMDGAGQMILEGCGCPSDTIPRNNYWSNQNLIKNWNFNTDLTSWGNWVDMAVPGQQFPVVENGVVKMTTGKASDGNYWHYQFNQQFLEAEANIPYILKFKSWSSIPKSNRVDFEDSPPFNDYIRYGASSDAQAIGGRSEWQYNTTTEPQWFTFHVVFDQIKPTTVQKVQWMLSNANAVTYLDSVLLIKQEDTIETAHHFLTLSTTRIGLEASEGNAMVDIASDVSWTASSNQPWLKLSSTAGTGNRSLILTVQANTLTNARKATITIKADGTATQTITVTQSAKPIPPGEHGQPTCGQKWSDETWNYQNLIRNWNFSTDLTYWGGWIDNLGPWQEPPTTENGVAVMSTALSADGNNWHYQFSQNGLQAEVNVPYLLKFKSWSSTPRSNGLLFEDTPQNNYTRYGASNDPEAIGGRSEWTYYTTIQPRWYTFHVVFDRMVPTTLQKIQWMLSTADATTYLDSVILIKGGDSIVANDDYLILSKNTLFMEEKAASASFTITSNAGWEIRSDQPWLNVDHTTGSGNQTITLTAPANTLYTNRMGTATIYVPGLKAQTVSVIQNARQGLPVDPGDSNLTENWSSNAWNDYNLIRNWNFTSGLTDWGWWVDGAVAGQLDPTVLNGTAAMTTFVSPDGNSWHYQLMQGALQAEPGVPYTLRFKSWSNIPRSNELVFEDSPQNNYNRYGASTDAESLNGRSEWIYFTSARPRWYTFHVVFDQMTPSTEQKIQWMLSSADATTYLDSIILIKNSDLLMVKEAQLALSASHLDVDYAEAQSTVDVSSNTNSLAISDQDWLTVYPLVVTGNKTISIATQANSTNRVRTATVTLYPAGLKAQTITIVQASTTAIKELPQHPEMTVYPNPTTGKIKLIMERMPEKGSWLTVIDLKGKTILKQMIRLKEESIDLKGNPPGLYLIKTSMKDSKAKKVVLTRE